MPTLKNCVLKQIVSAHRSSRLNVVKNPDVYFYEFTRKQDWNVYALVCVLNMEWYICFRFYDVFIFCLSTSCFRLCGRAMITFYLVLCRTIYIGCHQKKSSVDPTCRTFVEEGGLILIHLQSFSLFCCFYKSNARLVRRDAQFCLMHHCLLRWERGLTSLSFEVNPVGQPGTPLSTTSLSGTHNYFCSPVTIFGWGVHVYPAQTV